MSGCASWYPMRMETGIAPVVDANQPVRATRINQTWVVLWHPHVVGDSLIGDVGNPPLRTAVALRDLQHLEVLARRAPRAGEVAAGIGVGAAVVLLVGLTALMSMF